MDSFINEDFLLTTHISRQLYHEIAENLPVIDFHNHLDPQKLAENISLLIWQNCGFILILTSIV